MTPSSLDAASQSVANEATTTIAGPAKSSHGQRWRYHGTGIDSAVIVAPPHRGSMNVDFSRRRSCGSPVERTTNSIGLDPGLPASDAADKCATVDNRSIGRDRRARTNQYEVAGGKHRRSHRLDVVLRRPARE